MDAAATTDAEETITQLARKNLLLQLGRSAHRWESGGICVALESEDESVDTEMASESEGETSTDPGLAGVFQAALDGYLARKKKMPTVVDFHSCKNEGHAFVAVVKHDDSFSTEGDLMKVFQAALEDLNKTADVKTELVDGLEAAFESAYIGDAHKRFYNYIDACWKRHCGGPYHTYRYPYVALVQSSGFGKSRLLRELAIHFKTLDPVRAGLHRLVYVNVRNVEGSTGFPPRTKGLATYLFPNEVAKSDHELVQELAEKLVRVYDFVMQPEPPAIASKAKARKGKTTRPRTEMHDQLMALFSGLDGEFVGTLTSSTSASGTSSLQFQRFSRRLMVVAIDEARALLPEPDATTIDWFRIMRRALERANETISRTRKEAGSGVFAIFADTNSKDITDFVPSPAVMDPSQRVPSRDMLAFPPFVLTDTIDIHRATMMDAGGNVVPDEDSAAMSPLDLYKRDVAKAIANLPKRESWEDLRRLGRPLWLKCEPPLRNSKSRLTALAAQKLMRGRRPDKEFSFTEETLNGVASLLCRVSIRPRSSSPLAAGVVEDFMAVLSYVSHTHDQFVVSYSSDPILTLGAVRVWHDTPAVLAKKILPQLHRLVRQEMVDVGEIDEMVERIVLLLAMDACTKLELGSREPYVAGAGEFFCVWTFLKALHGANPRLRAPKDANAMEVTSSAFADASPDDTRAALAAVEERWKDWFVSFTHFVQLVESPSEACLWAMLGRRAAGIMPRGQRAVDLVIPVCRLDTKMDEAEGCPRVSMILVQVDHRERGDAVFPETLASLDLSDPVFRVHMNLRNATAELFYVEMDKLADDRSSYMLCLRGLGPIQLSEDSSSVTVLSTEVVRQLEKLLSPWWMLKTLVEQDVDDRDKRYNSFGEDKEELLRVATQPMADVLVLNTRSEQQLGVAHPSPSATGRAHSKPDAADDSHTPTKRAHEDVTADENSAGSQGFDTQKQRKK